MKEEVEEEEVVAREGRRLGWENVFGSEMEKEGETRTRRRGLKEQVLKGERKDQQLMEG